MRSRVLPGLFLLLALSGVALAAGAESLDRILPEIRRHTPGTFYDAQGPFMGPDGQMRYRIKWMTPDGRIVWFDADARSGRILGSYGGGEGPQDNGDPRRQRFRDDRDTSGGNGNSDWPGSVYDGGRGGGDRGGGRSHDDNGGRGNGRRDGRGH